MKFRSPIAALLIAPAIAMLVQAGSATATDGITQNAVGTFDLYYKNNPVSSTVWEVAPCAGEVDKCIQVTEFPTSDTERKNPRWTSTAYWTVGSWILVPVAAERTCQDDATKKFSVTYDFSWDAALNKGWRSYRDPGVCDGTKPSTNMTVQFNLVRVGPSPTP